MNLTKSRGAPHGSAAYCGVGVAKGATGLAEGKTWPALGFEEDDGRDAKVPAVNPNA